MQFYRPPPSVLRAAVSDGDMSRRPRYDSSLHEMAEADEERAALQVAVEEFSASFAEGAAFPPRPRPAAVAAGIVAAVELWQTRVAPTQAGMADARKRRKVRTSSNGEARLKEKALGRGVYPPSSRGWAAPRYDRPLQSTWQTDA